MGKNKKSWKLGAFFKKNAEITSDTLVKTILIIIGFAVLVLFIYFIYYQLSWNGIVDQEACHQSVIYRGTLPNFAGAKEFVPLSCKTQKVCITTGGVLGFGGGSCSEFNSSTGVETVKVTNKDQIEQFIARDIVSCWETMGEGKLSIFSSWLASDYSLGTVYPSCVICDRIAFDKDSLEKSGIKLSDINVNQYMATHAVPGQNVSYYEYISGQRGLVSFPDKMNLPAIQFDDNGKLVDVPAESVTTQKLTQEDPNSNPDLAIMFMQISSPKNVLKNDVTALGYTWGASAVIAPVMTIQATLNPITWFALLGVGFYQAYSVSENKAMSVSKCGDVLVGDKAMEGCSVVRTVNYNVNDLKNYCSYIESVP